MGLEPAVPHAEATTVQGFGGVALARWPALPPVKNKLPPADLML